ncbi:response regulator transcription factor [Paenibacillus sp. MER TA 81-3]|uniref:response regulator transcription factor n=1 Tax=Paenibacillus sp. MER TA 81-3 TaxID=2939573 RepID=UPI002041BA69|nr:response regulator transcription factor [Paenibacillus sp. MER TA 81-3]MCM3339177.1 response regulator transcription factor [Paenibacillus sp. MER TA 81-3]
MNILIADDEPHMLNIIKAYFDREGFRTYIAADGEAALNVFYSEAIDLAVLDWMMPKVSGIDVCREMKQRSGAKVLLLTAKGEAEDELKALQSGADDYVRKPFDPRILMLRAKKLLQVEDGVRLGNLTVDMQGYKIYKDGTDIQATNKEFLLLKTFIEHKGRILTRQTLLDQVWGFDYFGDDRTVDTHIRRLREKIGEHFIKTHRGVGYSLEVPKETMEDDE